MFIVNLCGTDLELPLSDEEMVAIKKEKKIDLFLRREDTICIKADYRGVDLKPRSRFKREITGFSMDTGNQYAGVCSGMHGFRAGA